MEVKLDMRMTAKDIMECERREALRRPKNPNAFIKEYLCVNRV